MENLANLLDKDAEYKATKISTKDKAGSRMVQKGDIAIGQATMLYDRLIVGDLMTSQVIDFSQNGKHFLVETKNSVYTLENLNVRKNSGN